jgi:hypothetical protein
MEIEKDCGWLATEDGWMDIGSEGHENTMYYYPTRSVPQWR